MVLALAALWISRERIADNLIAGELEKRGIPASYRIESIGAREQVLADLVIGDPARPDFTADRLVVSVRPRFGFPDIGALRLVRPRLYGTYLKGKLSFGALDPLIFTDSKEPFRLPDMDVAIEDGRGLIESEYGAAGIKLEGRGNLRSGFAGQLAASAPGLALGDCGVDRLTAYGRLSVSSERPRFDGPVRLAGLGCTKIGLKLADASIVAELTANSEMNEVEGSLSAKASRLSWQDYRLAGAGGKIGLTWQADKLLAKYDLAASKVDTPQLHAPRIAVAGQLRAADAFSLVDLQSDISGTVAEPGEPLLRALDSLETTSEGTFIATLARKAGAALRREARGATFAASLTARRRPQGDSVTVPGAVLRGSSGEALASLSRLHIRMGQGGPQRAGWLIPDRRAGHAAHQRDGAAHHRRRISADIAMAEYSAGDARLALPRLTVVQRGGRLGFAGNMRMSGAIPGGRADNLALPVAGDWSDRSGLTVWRNCTQVSFDGLRLSSLELSRRSSGPVPAARRRDRAIRVREVCGSPPDFPRWIWRAGSAVRRSASPAVRLAWHGRATSMRARSM